MTARPAARDPITDEPPEAPRERWSADAGERDVAHLDIPPDAARERRFLVSCSFVVRRHAASDEPAWHAMKVLADGAQQWARRAETQPGANDSLDLQFRRTVPVGQPLRLIAIGEVRGATRLGLSIVAEED